MASASKEAEENWCLRVALDRAGTNARAQPFLVDRLDALDDLKQTRASGHTVCLERRGDGQTDRLLRPALIRHDEVGGQRVQAPLYALHARIEALGVDGHVLPHLLAHALDLLSSNRSSFHFQLRSQFVSGGAASTYQRATRPAKAEFIHSKKRCFSSPRMVTV